MWTLNGNDLVALLASTTAATEQQQHLIMLNAFGCKRQLILFFFCLNIRLAGALYFMFKITTYHASIMILWPDERNAQNETNEWKKKTQQQNLHDLFPSR